MKKKANLLALFLGALVLSCNFSAGTKKDLTTGLSFSYNGFSVEEVILVGQDNVAMSTNEVPLGTQVAIVIQGLSNYELKNDKAFPGLMINVTDKEGKSVLSAEDVFEGTEGYSAADASVLRGTVTVGDPMKAGETYRLQVRAWDKNKPENELTAEVELVVK